MSIRFVYLIVLLSIATSLKSQSLILRGKIIDASSGEDLINAHIRSCDGKLMTLSNRYGYFTISSDGLDEFCISITYTGYSSLDTTLNAINLPDLVLFKMKPAAYLLDEIEIIGANLQIENPPGVVRLTKLKIEESPSFFGEYDLVKSLQNIPGVSSGPEGSSSLFIRGGTPDQNLVLLDNVPIYNINHLANFTSIFNSEAISHVNFYKENFPARYGGRLSSIVDIQMKEGNKEQFKHNYSIGPLSGKFMIEGPLNSKMSYMVSARRFWFDLITWPLSKILFEGIGVGYNFGDYNFKVNYKPSSKSQLFLSAYYGRDNINFKLDRGKGSDRIKSQFRQRWGNNVINFRWNKLIGKKLFLSNNLYYSEYEINILDEFIDNSENVKEENLFSNGIAEYGWKSNLEWILSENILIETGVSLGINEFNPGNFSYYAEQGSNKTQNNFTNEVPNNYLFSTYFSFDWKNKIFGIKAGLRSPFIFSRFDSQGQGFLEPRLNLSAFITKNHSIFFDYTLMNQFHQLLSKNGIGFPTDIWIPSTSGIMPSNAIQYSLGSRINLPCKKIKLEVSAFLKNMENLIAFKPGTSFYTKSNDWKDKVLGGGTGNNYGLEFFLEKSETNYSLNLGYTWMHSKRKFSGLNSGNWFPSRYDRRHQVNMVGSYLVNQNIKLSGSWSYHSGDAITLPIAKYPAIASDNQEHMILPFFNTESDAFYYGPLNGSRMKAFHRLDLSASFSKKKLKGKRIWDVSIINVYNRKNPYFYYYGNIDNNGSNDQLLQITLFPFLPSVSYTRIF